MLEIFCHKEFSELFKAVASCPVIVFFHFFILQFFIPVFHSVMLDANKLIIGNIFSNNRVLF